jgi:hypothetical protein
MNIYKRIVPIVLSLFIIWSCSVSNYITDPQSIERQKRMHEQRTGVNIFEGFLFVGSAILSAFTGWVVYHGEGQSYRKLKLLNQSADTLFVNLVTDYQWKDSAYFDIKDIVLPPNKRMRLIVPMGVSYNVYFRDAYDKPDEKIEINTGGTGTVKLNPEHAIIEQQSTN